MSHPAMFMAIWLLACGAVFGCVTALINYDIVMVFLLRALNAPCYPEARRIAWLLYRHPEQWAATSYSLNHAKLGELRGLSPATLSLHGAGFGEWTPTAVEKRIVWNAILWYRREQLRKTLDGTRTY